MKGCLRRNSSPDSRSRSRSHAGLRECEVRAEETGTLRELLLRGGNRDTFTVKLQGRAAGKLVSADNVHVGLDGTAAALHVASTWPANNPGNINTARSGVAGSETLLVCLSEN
jgi:hypothetical protein